MPKLPQALSQALVDFNPTGTAEALARALKSDRSGVSEDNVQEFLVWPLLGTSEHGLPTVSTATRNPHHAYTGQPDTVRAHFQALAPLVLTTLTAKAGDGKDKRLQSQADTAFEHIWKSVGRWINADGPEALKRERGTVCAEIFLACAPHLDRRWNQMALNSLSSAVNPDTLARLAFLERLTQPDGLDALAKAKVGLAPFFLVTQQKLTLVAGMLGEDDDKGLPSANAAASAFEQEGQMLKQHQKAITDRILAHPARLSLLRLDLNPVSAAEPLIASGFSSTPQRTMALAKALIPLYREKGKDAFADGLVSLLAGPNLENILLSADLEEATAFFREHHAYKPARGWEEVLQHTTSGALRRAVRAVNVEGVPLSKRVEELASAGEFLAGMLVTLDGKLSPMALNARVREIDQRWHEYMDHASFLDTTASQAGQMEPDQRQQAIDRLKLIFANPFLDTLRQERIRLNIKPEDRWKPTAGQVLVTLLDLQAPAPMPGKRPKP